VFIFEAIVEERYRNAGYDTKADAHAHRILIDYLAGKTDQDACACLQPVLDVAMHAEKPIVFDRHSSPGSAVIRPAGMPTTSGTSELKLQSQTEIEFPSRRQPF
jgi:hypothetical protein